MIKQVGRLCGVLVSGYASNGAGAGFVCAVSNYAPSHTYANIGSHLCLVEIDGRSVIPIDRQGTTALPLGKTLQVNPKGLVGLSL